MPTEFFQLAEKNPSISTQIQNERTTTKRKSGTIDYWRDIMQFGGWTENTTRSPRARVTVELYVEGLPVMTIPPLDELLDGTEVCEGGPAIIVTAPGSTEPLKVWGFDPGRYTPPPCEAFAYGSTQEQTAAAFKAKLQEALEMAIIDVTSSGGIETIVLEDPAPGTFMNGTRVSGWVGGTVWYGGWRLDSESYRGHYLSLSGRESPGEGGGTTNAWQIFVRLHSDGDAEGSAPVTMHLWLDPAYQDKYPWRVCICPYQFGIWMDGLGDGIANSGGATYGRSAFVSMPWVPTGFTGHTAFAFVISNITDNFRPSFEWDGYTWFDDGPWSPLRFNNVIVPTLRTRVTFAPDRITTTQGFLIVDNAYVTSIREPASGLVIEHRLAGKLWNCCTVSDHYPFSTVLGTIMSGEWIHVSSQDYGLVFPQTYGAQKVSLWWRFDNTEVRLDRR